MSDLREKLSTEIVDFSHSRSELERNPAWADSRIRLQNMTQTVLESKKQKNAKLAIDVEELCISMEKALFARTDKIKEAYDGQKVLFTSAINSLNAVLDIRSYKKHFDELQQLGHSTAIPQREPYEVFVRAQTGYLNACMTPGFRSQDEIAFFTARKDNLSSGHKAFRSLQVYALTFPDGLIGNYDRFRDAFLEEYNKNAENNDNKKDEQPDETEIIKESIDKATEEIKYMHWHSRDEYLEHVPKWFSNLSGLSISQDQLDRHWQEKVMFENTAKASAQKHVGENGRVFRSDPNGTHCYRGKILDVTETHAIQRFSDEAVYIHALRDFPERIKPSVGENLALHYTDGKITSVEHIQPKNHAKTQQKDLGR